MNGRKNRQYGQGCGKSAITKSRYNNQKGEKIMAKYASKRWQLTMTVTAAVIATMCLVYATGCKDPGSVGRFRATPVTNIILDSLGVVDEDPKPFSTARDPYTKDLIADRSEYIIGPGDVLDISIYELLGTGHEWVGRKQVSETGRITVPVIGTFRAVGRTELELTEDVKDMLSPHIIKDPKVSVVVIGSVERIYSISGAINAPGTYPLRETDFRISEAMAQAGGIPPSNADFAYVIRKVSAERAYELTQSQEYQTAYGQMSQQKQTATTAQPTPPQPAPMAEQKIPQQTEEELWEIIPPSQEQGQTDQQEIIQDNSSPQQEMDELLESVAPMATLNALGVAQAQEEIELYSEELISQYENAILATALMTDAAETQYGGVTEEDKPFKIIRKGNRFYLAPRDIQPKQQTKPQPQPQTRQIPPSPQPQQDTQQKQPGTDAIGLAGQMQEVVRVNLKKLRNGDLAQNIVIRAGDDIHVPFNSIGIFYVMGQVLRSGAYSLTGDRITLKQAIANAGPMTSLAEPRRCEIWRRIGGDKEVVYMVNLEKLFAGTAPDVFLKSNDVINIGSHPAARWIAVIRQSFRATYGFGFVYDRNLADKDFGH